MAKIGCGHTSRQTIHLMATKFDDRIISRNSDMNLLQRSCDLTSLDYFLRSFLKSKVYANVPQISQYLKNNIRAKIEAVGHVLFERLIQNFDIRMQACKKSRGGHTNDSIFYL